MRLPTPGRILQSETRLTRLICVDRHNRFDHHDFRVMAAGTSTVWAFYVQAAVPMRLPDAGRLIITDNRGDTAELFRKLPQSVEDVSLNGGRIAKT